MMDFSEDRNIRWHSRAGQGAVSAAQFLTEAFLALGMKSMAFPSFGAEKRGAPVEVYNRIASHPIDDPAQPRKVDVVILLEPSLVGAELSHDIILAGLKADGILLINTESEEKSGFHKKFGGKIFHVPATKIAFDTVGRNVPNVATVGALVRIFELEKAKLRTFLETNLSKTFSPEITEKNMVAFDRGYENVQEITGSKGGAGNPVPASTGSTWSSLPQAAIIQAGTSRNYHPGNWVPNKRITYVPKNCIQCGICWAVCPDNAILHDKNGNMIGIDQDACKRCGLCVRSCSANKIANGDPSKCALVRENIPPDEQENF